MAKAIENMKGHGFGTAPVFLAAISTLLGAILFLRFGYCVGNIGLLGAVALIFLGHLVTIPTGLAVSEIATNLKVEGGGEYFIISRSFGTTIGAAIGIFLYISQAISVSFYLIAFAEAFQPLFQWIHQQTGFLPDPRMVSLPAAIVLIIFILKKGASLGVRILWVVVAVLVTSLVMFFLGSGSGGPAPEINFSAAVENGDDFFKVFAICFPAFTGMTAGVGLSGDLKNPGKSIPLGTLAGTLVGMITYVAVVFKLGMNATPEELATDQLVMMNISVWGPSILIGLAAACISSAVGSMLIAPRTLQALATDRVFPVPAVNRILSRGRGQVNEPDNAAYFTAVVVVIFIALGDVDFVAQLISMFFMITYGSLCAISFLQHFAANPSYRPSFKSRWYISLTGAVMCFMVMFQMQPLYALLALIMMFLAYSVIQYNNKTEKGIVAIFQGVMFQLTRWMQISIQRKRSAASPDWRPSFVSVSEHSLSRLAAFELLRWLSHRHGFGTYIHFIPGNLRDTKSVSYSREAFAKLVDQTKLSRAGVFVDTIIAESYLSALEFIVQLPGVSGMENNSMLFEFDDEKPEEIPDIIEGARISARSGFNTCILRSSERRFGYKQAIHIWITKEDFRNANMMILLAYVIMGHPEWKNAQISLYASFPMEDIREERATLNEMIRSGRLPISAKNINWRLYESDEKLEEMIQDLSSEADLTIVGFDIRQLSNGLLLGNRAVKDLLFVNAKQKILIS